MKRFLLFLSLVVTIGCSCSRQTICLSQAHVITGIDTVGKNLYLHLRPAGKLQSIYGVPFRQGDTIQKMFVKTLR